MPAGKGDFSAVLQDKDITHQVHDARVLHVFKIDNAVAPGAEELRLVESPLAVAKRAANKHGGTNPIDPAVVSFRFQAKEVRHAKDAALHKVVVVQRFIAAELVENFAGVGVLAVLLRGRGNSDLGFRGNRWLLD